MLTKEAFNALLKTLEEPPAHAVFILATTETDKLPETVVSRCQTFSFKKPSQKILKEVVLDLSKREGYSIEPSSAELIALLGDGSFRDTEGILQKVLSSSKDKKISPEEVATVTGAPRSDLINAFIKGIESKDASAALKAVKQATDHNIDMAIFIKLVLFKLRAILLLKFSPDMKAALETDFSAEDFALLKEFSEKKELGINSKTILEFLKAQENARISPIPELPLELAVVQIVSK